MHNYIETMNALKTRQFSQQELLDIYKQYIYNRGAVVVVLIQEQKLGPKIIDQIVDDILYTPRLLENKWVDNIIRYLYRQKKINKNLFIPVSPEREPPALSSNSLELIFKIKEIETQARAIFEYWKELPAELAAKLYLSGKFDLLTNKLLSSRLLTTSEFKSFPKDFSFINMFDSGTQLKFKLVAIKILEKRRFITINK